MLIELIAVDVAAAADAVPVAVDVGMPPMLDMDMVMVVEPSILMRGSVRRLCWRRTDVLRDFWDSTLFPR